MRERKGSYPCRECKHDKGRCAGLNQRGSHKRCFEEKGPSSNADRIRSMTDEELAEFINFSNPSCNEVCPDADFGCAFKCKHRNGYDVLFDWLQQPVEVVNSD